MLQDGQIWKQATVHESCIGAWQLFSLGKTIWHLMPPNDPKHIGMVINIQRLASSQAIGLLTWSWPHGSRNLWPSNEQFSVAAANMANCDKCWTCCSTSNMDKDFPTVIWTDWQPFLRLSKRLNRKDVSPAKGNWLRYKMWQAVLFKLVSSWVFYAFVSIKSLTLNNRRMHLKSWLSTRMAY